MMLKILFNFFAMLPNTASQYLGIVVGKLLHHSNHREKRVAEKNIALCFPDLSDIEQQLLLKKTLIENAKTLLEIPRIFNKGGDYAIRLVTAIEGIDDFHRALFKEKGVIILAPHLGNWELVVHYLNQFSPITAMFAPPKQDFLNDIMRNARESSGAKLVPADTSGVRAQLKQLKKGGVVGILPDQQPKHGHASVFAPFMGYSASTMLLVNSLAKRTDATIVYAFAERRGIGKGYKVHIFPAPEGLADENELLAATKLNEGVEHCVRIAPAQYQWTYKRFKQQPDGHSPYD